MQSLPSALLAHYRWQSTATAAGDVERTPEGVVVQYGHWLLSLGLMYSANKALAQATAAAGISFPSPLIGAPWLGPIFYSHL